MDEQRRTAIMIIETAIEVAFRKRGGLDGLARAEHRVFLRALVRSLRWLRGLPEGDEGGVPWGAYGPVLIRDVYGDGPDEVGYYDDEDACDECGSVLAVVLVREGGDKTVPRQWLEPCSREVWDAAGFDPTRSLLGEDQSPDEGEVS